MSNYYKMDGAVLMVHSVVEWKGHKMTNLITARTMPHGYPFGITSKHESQLDANCELATEEEWIAALAIAEKRQAEIDKAAAKKAEGEKYGIKVERLKSAFYTSPKPTEGDTIVRCTKTRWVGLRGSYKRTVTYGQPGEMIKERGHLSGPSVSLTKDSLETLAKRADSRLVVDFVKEAKKAEKLL